MLVIHDSLAEQVHDEIKRRILTSELALGDRLHVELLASELNVSSSPVKEALKQLEREGLVEIKPRSGTVVRRFTRQEVVDVYGARRIIEPAAAAIVVQQGAASPDLIAALEQTMEALADASSGASFTRPLDVTDTDSTFHRLIVEAIGNAVLTEMHSTLIDRARLVRNYASRGPRAVETLGEHRRIVDALKRGDQKEAAKASARHLEEAEIFILRSMSAETVFEDNEAPTSQPTLKGR